MELGFWLLIDAETKEPLPAEQQPSTDKMADVTAFMRRLRRGMGQRIGIVLVTPHGRWEDLVPEGAFPSWYLEKLGKSAGPVGR